METEVINTKGSFDLCAFRKKTMAEEEATYEEKVFSYAEFYSAQELAELLVTALDDAEAQRESNERNRAKLVQEFRHFIDVFKCYS